MWTPVLHGSRVDDEALKRDRHNERAIEISLHNIVLISGKGNISQIRHKKHRP